MGGIKFYHIAKGEELPDECCVVRAINEGLDEYTFYVRDAKEDKLREYITRLEQANIVLDSDNCDLRNDMKDMQFFIAENAKLRELVKAAWGCVHSGVDCYECRVVAGGCTLQSAMRELGIEVDDE